MTDAKYTNPQVEQGVEDQGKDLKDAKDPSNGEREGNLIESDEFQEIIGKLSQRADQYPGRQNKWEKIPDDIKLAATGLYAAGMPILRIANAFKVSDGTVHSWIKNPSHFVGEDAKIKRKTVENVKSGLSDRLFLEATRVLNSISDEDLAKAKLVEKSIAAKNLLSDARLLAGESTENVSVQVRHINECKSEEDELDLEIMKREAMLKRAIEVVSKLEK